MLVSKIFLFWPILTYIFTAIGKVCKYNNLLHKYYCITLLHFQCLYSYAITWIEQVKCHQHMIKKMLLPMFCWNYIFSKKVQNLQHWHSANTQKTSFGRSLGFCGRSFVICVQVCRFMCNARWSEREKHLKIKQKWLCIAHNLFETLWSHTHTHLSHWLHLKGLAPVCFLKCLVSSSLRAKRHSQPSHEHLYGFSPAGSQQTHNGTHYLGLN